MAGSADRAIAVATSGTPTALETTDWTLDAASKTLERGAQSIDFEITVVDDATLEGDESVSFAISANGAAAGSATLSIADDDRAMLSVAGPTDTDGEDVPVSEGDTAFTLTLRLEPRPENGPSIADDACFLDFAVAATLSVESGGDELSGTPAFPIAVNFPATSLSDCTREVEVSLATRASDGVWHPDREIVFALERDAGQDERVDPGTGSIKVRDDSPVPGPLVTGIEVAPLPATPDNEERTIWTKPMFDALPDEAVHGRGVTLTFTLTFDNPVTVTRNAQTRASPELTLDVYGRTRLARYTGPIGTPTRTMTFRWTVRRGDYDPDGLVVRGLGLNGATVLDSQARRTPPDRFPAEHFRVHRVRGGYFETRITASGPAREGAPFTIRATRDGDVDARGFAAVEVADNAVEQVQQIAVEFHPKDSELSDGNMADGLSGYFILTPPPDGQADPGGVRTMTIRLHDTATSSVWYDAAGTLEITVKVADNELPADVPVLAVGPADVHEPETGTVPLKFRVCLWIADELCPDAGKNEAFEAYEGVTHQVTVDYATRDGTAEAHKDYLPTSGTLTFEPGERVKTVEVMVLADAHDEGIETVWLELSNPVGATLGRWRNFGQIHNDGPIPKAWIVRFGRTVGSQVVDRLTQRLDAGDESQATLGGISLFGGAEPDETALEEPTLGLPEWEERTRLDAERTMTGQELLLGSAFHLSSGNREEGLSLTAWGSVAVGGFDATEDDLTPAAIPFAASLTTTDSDSPCPCPSCYGRRDESRAPGDERSRRISAGGPASRLSACQPEPCGDGSPDLLRRGHLPWPWVTSRGDDDQGVCSEQ